MQRRPSTSSGISPNSRASRTVFSLLPSSWKPSCPRRPALHDRALSLTHLRVLSGPLRAADALCPNGDHRADWDPSRIHVEPLMQKAKPGATVKATRVAANPRSRKEKLTAVLDGRGLIPDQTWELEIAPGGALSMRSRCSWPKSRLRAARCSCCGRATASGSSRVMRFWSWMWSGKRGCVEWLCGGRRCTIR